jgi:hypothetical protein
MPEAAKENSRAGAIAFVRHYVELQNYATRTGDTDALRRVISPKCSECLAVPDFIDKTYRAGGRIEGKGWDVLAVAFVSNAPGPTDYDYVDATLRINEQAVFGGPTASPSVYPGNPARSLSLGLEHQGSSWLLSRIVVRRK